MYIIVPKSGSNKETRIFSLSPDNPPSEEQEFLVSQRRLKKNPPYNKVNLSLSSTGEKFSVSVSLRIHPFIQFFSATNLNFHRHYTIFFYLSKDFSPKHNQY